jgi:mRNA interferase HigB
MHRIICESAWKSLAEVREAFPHADAVKVRSGKIVTVFNVGGTGCRLISAIHYNRQCLYTLLVLTHEEYERGKWKDLL